MLPDNQTIVVEDNFLKQIPELFFRPELNYLNCDSLHVMSWKSVSESEFKLQRDLLQNVVLSGGSMMFEGIADRLRMEINRINTHMNLDVDVLADDQKLTTVWRGASAFASQSTFSASMITKADYQEHGASLAQRK